MLKTLRALALAVAVGVRHVHARDVVVVDCRRGQECAER